MLKQTAQSFDPGQHINFGGRERDYVDLGSYQDVVHRHNTAEKLGIRLIWDSSRSGHFLHSTSDGPKSTCEFQFQSIEFNIFWGLDTAIFIDQLRYDTELVDAPPAWIAVHRESADKFQLTMSSSNHESVPKAVSSPRSCFMLPPEAANWPPASDRVSLLYVGDEFVSLVDCIEYLGPLRIRPERHYLWTGTKPDKIAPDGANTIETLIASSRQDEFLANRVALGLTELDLVEAFGIHTVDENNRLYEFTATIGGVESSLNDVGFGVSQVLPVITMLLSAPEGSIVLLEQPELHLHPNAQAALADLLLDVAEKRNLQLIVESHSEHIVRRLQRRTRRG